MNHVNFYKHWFLLHLLSGALISATLVSISLVLVRLWRILKVARIPCLTPFVLLGKVTGAKCLFLIIYLTMFLLSQQVSFLCERRINFFHFEMLPPLSR